MRGISVATYSRADPIYLDRHAAGADRILPVNRVKPHTCFKGPIESGCTKMAVVGFGKQPGAALTRISSSRPLLAASQSTTSISSTSACVDRSSRGYKAQRWIHAHPVDRTECPLRTSGHLPPDAATDNDRVGEWRGHDVMQPRGG